MIDLATIVNDPERIHDLLPEETAGALMRLATLQAALTAHLTSPRARRGGAPPPDANERLLTPSEAAAVLRVTLRWLYRHSGRLAFTRRLSRKTLRFSEAGLRQYLAEKRT